MGKLVVVWLIVAFLPAPAPCDTGESGDWVVGAYLDVGYLGSNNKPENRTWRSKSTTFKLDRLEANMLTAYASKGATDASRWGFELGLQTGVDVDGLVPSETSPPSAAIDNASDWAALAPTTLSCLFPAGKGLLVTGGLLNGYIAYESFHARYNPNYTRGYLTDYVPYFSWGLQISYPFTDRLTADLIVSWGYNYLTHLNDAPRWGTQLTWRPAGNLTFVQNLYYGPDQSNTDREYWRFLSDTILEWQSGRYLLAGSFDFGNERQAWAFDTPYQQWMAGALWGRLDIDGSWRVAVRPEFYWDPDGLMTGARQTIRAVTATLEYHAGLLKYNSLSARLEYRYDRSTGDDGGFYKGSDNHLVPDQNLLIVALMWTFEWRKSAW